MKKNKGFTLMELLAVIVILGIIVTIVTPIVVNVINTSRENADRNSVTLYGKAIDNAVKTYMASDNGKVPSGEYSADDTGRVLTNKQDNTQITVDVKGNDIKCDLIIIDKKGNVYLTQCKIEDNYIYKKGSKSEFFSYGNKTYSNGEVVYFDVDTGKKCTNYTETQSNTGVKSGCMKFYAFNDDGGDKLNLILDHNTTATIAWNSSLSNETGPDTTFLNQLKTDTDTWKGTITPEDYTLDQSTQTSGANYTIDYSNYKARIITANEIAQITGNSSFDESVSSDSHFYFDTNTYNASPTCESGNTTGCKYGWLYDRTRTDCTAWGCSNNSDATTAGYWTITAPASNSINAWNVGYFGRLTEIYCNVNNSSLYGIRPVITVLKSKL